MPLSVVPPPEEQELPEKIAGENEAVSAGPEADPVSGSDGGRGDKAPRFGRLRASARTANLDSLEPHELITLVEDLEDDRAKARVREGIWISVIAHIVLFWLYAYAPQVLLHRPRVVNPADIMAKNAKQYEYLDLPPDALKSIKPKDSKIISDKDRVAQTRTPTLDAKTLQQLEAMKRAGPVTQPPGPQGRTPPAPAPAQQAPQQPTQNSQNTPPAPQPQQQRPIPTPQPQEPQPTQQATNNPPGRSQAQPNFNALSHGTVHDQIQNSLQSAGSGGGGGEGGLNAPRRHQGINSGMEILSDTMGVDFGPYMAHLKYLIERAWYPLIPEAARPPISKQGVVQIRFRIGPNGELMAGAMHLDGRSGDVSLDRAAWGGITGASPLPPLPASFKGPYLEIRGAFLYNINPDQLK